MGNGRTNGDYTRREAPPLQKTQGWATQLQRRNYRGEENPRCDKVSGLSRILAPAAGRCGKDAALTSSRVYNEGNLFGRIPVFLNDCAIWRHDGDSCSE
jgi:hypothetical protein